MSAFPKRLLQDPVVESDVLVSPVLETPAPEFDIEEYRNQLMREARPPLGVALVVLGILAPFLWFAYVFWSA